MTRNLGAFLADTVIPRLAEITALHRAASEAWDQAAFAEAESSPLHRAARLLATNPHPALSRTEMSRALLPEGTERDRRQLMAELAEVCGTTKAMVEAGGRRWQLGRTGLDFGGRGQRIELARRHATLASVPDPDSRMILTYRIRPRVVDHPK